MQTVNDIRQEFKQLLQTKEFVTDRSGSKTIEILGASFLANESAIFGTPNKEYIDAEIEWYKTQSTNINVLKEIYGKAPAAWQYTANDSGEVNSNYGYLIFSDRFHRQYDKVVAELVNNPYSRRAQLVYNRPSIWSEYNEQGKNDFICTNAQTFYIRDKKLHMVSQMRSNDAIFGYKNDYAWARYVQGSIVKEYNMYMRYVDRDRVVVGDLHWQVMNLHVYERHFELI